MRSLAKALPLFTRNRFTIILTTVTAAILFGIFEYLVNRWMLSVKLAPGRHALVEAFIVGLGGGFAQFMVLLGLAERRKMFESELTRVAELNHCVRNSLEVIVLASHSQADLEHREMVLESTKQIDRKLKELFPGQCR